MAAHPDLRIVGERTCPSCGGPAYVGGTYLYPPGLERETGKFLVPREEHLRSGAYRCGRCTLLAWRQGVTQDSQDSQR